MTNDRGDRAATEKREPTPLEPKRRFGPPRWFWRASVPPPRRSVRGRPSPLRPPVLLTASLGARRSTSFERRSAAADARTRCGRIHRFVGGRRRRGESRFGSGGQTLTIRQPAEKRWRTTSATGAASHALAFIVVAGVYLVIPPRDTAASGERDERVGGPCDLRQPERPGSIGRAETTDHTAGPYRGSIASVCSCGCGRATVAIRVGRDCTALPASQASTFRHASHITQPHPRGTDRGTLISANQR